METCHEMAAQWLSCGIWQLGFYYTPQPSASISAFPCIVPLHFSSWRPCDNCDMGRVFGGGVRGTFYISPLFFPVSLLLLPGLNNAKEGVKHQPFKTGEIL